MNLDAFRCMHLEQYHLNSFVEYFLNKMIIIWKPGNVRHFLITANSL